jgi:hypothetical protein
VLSTDSPLVSFAELTALRPLNAYVPDRSTARDTRTADATVILLVCGDL